MAKKGVPVLIRVGAMLFYMFSPTVRYETGSCKIVQYTPNFRSTLDYPSIYSIEAKERGAFR